MLKVFFISLLVVTSKTPAEGWIQWSQSYANQEVCLETIGNNYQSIEAAARASMKKGVVKSIKEFRCLTYDEAVELNTKLGH